MPEEPKEEKLKPSHREIIRAAIVKANEERPDRPLRLVGKTIRPIRKR